MVTEGFRKIDIDYKKSDWVMDQKGYFLIDIDRKNKLILVAHFTPDGKKDAVIEGSDPIALYYTILKNGMVSLMTHSAYLGQELEKAFLAIRYGFKYVQDDILSTQLSDEDIHSKGGAKEAKYHSSGEFQKKKQEEYCKEDGSQYH
ncbi:MAG: hypothetical protein AABX47_09530 [Nanoarchaeota archaeon]